MNKYDPQMDLLLKKIEGQLTQKEEVEFQKWLYESDENRQRFEQMLLLRQEGKQYALYQKIDVDVAWAKVMQRAKKDIKKPRRMVFLKNPLRIAASIVLLVATGFLLKYSFNASSQEVVSFGQPGSFQAYLSIENQNEIKVSSEVKELKNIPNGIQNNVQGELRYDLQGEKAVAETHTLKVPIGGEYKIVLEDGTKVWLNSETKLKYPSKFGAEQRLVQLEGEAYFEVTKDPHRPFIVSTNQMDIEVLGTAFNVAAYLEDDVYSTTLVEGKVNIQEHSGIEKILKPGDQHSLSVKSMESEVVQVETKFATDWKDGRYIFRNENLENVLEELSKWYALEYEFLDESLKTIKYTGMAIKNKPLPEFLDAIAAIKPIEFRIENQKLFIKKGR